MSVAILFDAVGTLVYADPPVALAYHAVGQQFGSRLSVESIRLRFREAVVQQETLDAAQNHRTSDAHEQDRWRSIVTHVYEDLVETEALFLSLWNHFAQPQHWRVYDDVSDCLEFLTEEGHVQGIASNFDERLHAICEHHAALASLRPFVSSRIGHKKPSLQFFRAIEQQLRLPAAQILMVGDDRENDFHAARRAGWPALLLDRRHATTHSCVPQLLRTLDELPDWLDDQGFVREA